MSWAHNKILITTINTTINFLHKVAHTNLMLFNGSPAETEARRREVKRGRLFMRVDMGLEAARNKRLARIGQIKWSLSDLECCHKTVEDLV